MKGIYILFVLLLSVFSAYGQGFVEVSEEAGINHAFRVDLATFGGGVAILDFNNDGWEDFYLTGGNDSDALYRNNGDGTFTDVFLSAGLESTIPVHTQGVSAADINRDGFKDLLITTMYYHEDRALAPNLLFINRGDGTFEDVTEQFGLDEFKSNSMSATFGDINADGYPDLYVANYFAISPVGVSIFNDQTITNNYASAQDFLFINASGQFFVDGTHTYGMGHAGFGFQGVFTDWDNDNDQDLLIVNDFGFRDRPNIALRNDFPQKSLTDRSVNLQMNFGMNAMGIAVGDYNFDGYIDYFVSNISESLFAVNNEGTGFDNAGIYTGIAIKLIDNPNYVGVPVSWGANFFDYDNDTDLDLFVNNGALNPTIRPNPNFLLRNDFGFYRELGNRVGVDDPRIGRGSAVFDYDNDGDLDLLVVNQHPRDPTTTLPEGRTLLYRNDIAVDNWLKIQLDGVRSEKNGIGSRVEVRTNDKLLIREIDGGSGHMSQNSTIAHFGLENATAVESVTVKWIGGGEQTLENVTANQLLTITQEDDRFGEDFESALNIFPTYFTDQVLIEYQLEKEEPFDISVYDITGKLITTLVRQDNPASSGFWNWDVDKDLIRGMYIIQLRTASGVIAKKAMKI